MESISVQATLDIPITRIADLLCTAFEGDVGYWACIVGYNTPSEPRSVYGSKTIHKYVDYPLTGGAIKLTIQDDEDAQTDPYIIDGDAISRGLNIMAKKYPRHFANFIQEQEDAETGDVFVQCCIFGEIVYG